MHPRLEMFYSNYFTASTFKLSPSSPCQALPSPTPIPGQGVHYLWKHPILLFHKGSLCLLLPPVSVVCSVPRREGAVTAFSDSGVSPQRIASGLFASTHLPSDLLSSPLQSKWTAASSLKLQKESFNSRKKKPHYCSLFIPKDILLQRAE